MTKYRVDHINTASAAPRQTA